MISDARGGHVSPGIYTNEKDVTYSVKSLGITSLGLVGETLYGPAFENIPISDWTEYVNYFGGTSPEKFRDTGLPKYELPYIAKSYLEESKQLNVVRVLGLSGYDAGKAWVLYEKVTEDNTTVDKPVVILRSKLVYGVNDDICQPTNPDMISEVVESIVVGAYLGREYTAECGESISDASSGTTDINKFSITVNCKEGMGYDDQYKYNVSLNPYDGNYIYNVLGRTPNNGNCPIYVEAIYEGNHVGSSGVTTVSGISACTIPVVKYYQQESKNVINSAATVYKYVEVEKAFIPYGTVIQETTSADSYYSAFSADSTEATFTTSGNIKNYISKFYTNAVFSDAYMNYKEMYRPAQTPWFVSDVTATYSGETPYMATMHKLFKFITISDGNAANYQVKVSIQKIDPTNGTFDVLIRDFNDTDASPVILEKFSNCNLVEGSSNYLPFKIGSSDGGYESRSKYVTVEMAEDDDLSNYIPAGFLGYPMPTYTDKQSGHTINVNYNTKFSTFIKPKKQYFGLNSDVLDEDMLAYKGKYYYDGVDDSNPVFLTKGFHMDSILSVSGFNADNTYINGTNGYEFTTVSQNKVGNEKYIPRLINASYINETIYKDINTRKFTAYFYGGFDGWDIHRLSRTNTDDYNAAQYEKTVGVFTPVPAGIDGVLNLPSTAITSDYYAYLAGYRVFANPQDIDINLFATPGIDWYNNRLLTEEAIDIIEDGEDGRGGDALYIINSPKYLDSNELVDELDASEINTSYGATYYPWIKYYDTTNKRYLDLPVTKDVVRNMAQTDNNSYPWFAPAGFDRGNVNCVQALHKTTLSEEDDLYAGRINPVKTFAKDGVKVWGNKTLYTIESPLNRVNVRRLMIRVKKLVTEAAKHLIFEQYDDTLEKQFRGLVEPILADVKSNRGIFDYRVMTEVTPETRDQHILPARILIKPTPSLEYISITFVVYPESVQFEQ